MGRRVEEQIKYNQLHLHRGKVPLVDVLAERTACLRLRELFPPWGLALAALAKRDMRTGDTCIIPQDQQVMGQYVKAYSGLKGEKG